MVEISDASLLLDELRERVHRFLEMAARIGVPPEELAEEALEIWPPPDDEEAARRMADRVDDLASSMNVPRKVVTGAVMLPPGRAKAFEAIQSAFAFRDRLAREHGGPFSDSTEPIREDRER